MGRACYSIIGSVIAVLHFGDEGSRDSVVAWRLDEGTVEGVGVSGLAVALSTSTPGHGATSRAAIFVDESAAPSQHDALLKLVTGQLGGPVADLTGLIEELGAIERVPIRLDSEGDGARLKIGASVEAQLRMFESARLRRIGDRHGLAALDVDDASAILGRFCFQA